MVNQDIVERIEARINDTDHGVMLAAQEHILDLRYQLNYARSLLTEIYNCTEYLENETLAKIDKVINQRPY